MSDAMPRRIVLLGSQHRDPEVFIEELRRVSDLDSPVEVSSIGYSGGAGTRSVTLKSQGATTVDRILVSLGAYRARRTLARFPAGRLANSLGPVAPARVFWRALRANPRASELLRDADVAVAVDQDGVTSAWKAFRAGWVSEAFYFRR